MSSKDVSFLSLHEALRDFGFLMQELADPYMVDLDVTQVQIKALEFIIIKKTVTASEIADFLKIQPAAVSTLIKRLEKKQYIHRMKSKEDRRTVHIKPTTEGIEVYEEIFKRYSRLLDQVYAGLDEQEHFEFERIIRKLTLKAEQKLLKKSN